MGLIRLSENLELDPQTYELRRDGRTVRLERIPMEILLLLLERRPELVTREQIAEKVWGPEVFVDTGNSINAAIFKLRHALRDDPENPRFIRTITGKGYRFLAEPLPPAAAPPVQEPAEQPLTPVPTADAQRPHGLRWWILIAALVVVAATVGMIFRGSRSSSPTLADRRLMLAVLPFDNLTGDPAQDYFSDGFTEEMITRLGALQPRQLGVIARTSVMQYKQSPASMERLARELGVQYVLEGSVRREGSRVRLTAQLIELEGQTHLWARQFDREVTDVLHIQADIAQAIADQIELTLGASRESLERSSVFSERGYAAYDHYLRGRYFWNQRTPDGFRQAVSAFQQAIEANPKDARAYAGLADTYTLMGAYGVAPVEEVIPKARDAALKALDIDENLGAALTSLALINETYDLDFKTAEDRFRRAIELEPNYATAHHWYAEFLAYQGRFDEAFAEIGLARKLDPHSMIMAVDHGYILTWARRYDAAIEQFRAVLAVEPNFGRAIGGIIGAYVLQGRLSEALAEAHRWEQIAPEEHWPWGAAAYVYGLRGEREKALKALQKAEEVCRRNRQDVRAPRGIYFTGMGMKDEAIAILQEQCKEHPQQLIAVKVAPGFDWLRDDPRFQEIVRCVYPEAGPSRVIRSSTPRSPRAAAAARRRRRSRSARRRGGSSPSSPG